MKEIIDIFKPDNNYSFFRFLKSVLNMLSGEKIVEYEGKYVFTSFLPPFPSRAFKHCILAKQKKKNYYTQQMYAQCSAPISFFLEVTNRCEMNCVQCSAKGRKTGTELTKEEWKQVICDMQDMGTSIIGFTGGEPLLREDLCELIESVDDRSISYLFTSGKGFTEEKAFTFKQKGLFGVGVSLDSYIPEKYNNKCRNEYAFDYATKALKIAKDAGLYTFIQMLLLKKDIQEKELRTFFAFARDLGVHEVRIMEPIKCGKFFLDAEDTFYSDQDRKFLIEIQHRANRSGKYPKISSFAFTECERKYGCGAGIQHSYLTASGELFPCDFLPLSFGNVKKKRIHELWSEMNRTIGIPHIGCFAHAQYNKIKEYSKKGLPLTIEDAKEICLSGRSNTFPLYYKLLQGKKR